MMMMTIIIIFFSERGRKGEREGGKEREADSCMHSIWDQAHNPGMFPDPEPNWRPFTLRDDTQPTEPCQLGQGWRSNRRRNPAQMEILYEANDTDSWGNQGTPLGMSVTGKLHAIICSQINPMVVFFANSC